MSNFFLSKIFEAHRKDVKKVVGVSLNSILTTGRDGQLKFWTERQGQFAEAFAAGDKEAINSVAFWETPDEVSIIFAGRKDGAIVIYESGNPQPIRVLNGHRMNVCALLVDESRRLLLSGSFDHTSLVWDIEKAINVEHYTPGVLDGHSNSIWAVASLPTEPISILTGSADKIIRLFKCAYNADDSFDAEIVKTFKGHEDVVRQIQVLSAERFISASNDSTVRLWNVISGQCLQVHPTSHGEYIYDLCMMTNRVGQTMVISCGEKGYIDVWEMSNEEGSSKDTGPSLTLAQTVRTPSHSVWSVSSLRSGDFVAGVNTGQVYIFTRDEGRRAPEAIQQAFDEQLSFLIAEELTQHEEHESTVKINVQTDQGVLELIYMKGMDPVEAAFEFIQKNGLSHSFLDEITKFIVDNIPEAKAVQSSRNKRQDSARHSIDGKKYDYTFEVSREAGKPPIIMGYNIGEDPDFAAQRFCEQHNLPIIFLQKLSTLLREQVPELQSNGVGTAGCFSDPFTGGNRYMPGSSAQKRHSQANGAKVDKRKPRSALVPLRQYFFFGLEGASTKTLQKLEESNNAQTKESLKLSDAELDALCKVMLADNFCADALHVSAFQKCLCWSFETLVPALDIFRVALLNEDINASFLQKNGAGTLQTLIDFLKNGSDPICILTCRAFANSCAHNQGQSFLMLQVSLLSALLAKQFSAQQKKNLQLAAASALANIARILLLSAEHGEVVTELGPREDILGAILDELSGITQYGDYHPYSLIRMLQAISTLMWGSMDIIRVGKGKNVVAIVNRMKDALHEDDEKMLCRDIVEMTYD